MYLIYINRIGTTFKGEHIFEFLFSNSIDWEWDESWYESSVMTDTRELSPNESIIKVVGTLIIDSFGDNSLVSVITDDSYQLSSHSQSIEFEKRNSKMCSPLNVVPILLI
jgi:hypothetical protein